MERSDEALMIAYQLGDEKALELLVRRHANNLLGYLIKMVRDHAQAEDLFQETFIRVHAKANTFKKDGRFKPWLFAIATHLALDTLRKQKRRPLTLSIDEETETHVPLKESISNGGPTPADDLERSDLKDEVRRAIDTLPPRQRATLVLAYFEGLPYKDVAKTLGCTVGTVKTQMSRALQTLSRTLPKPEPLPVRGGAA